MSRLGKKPVTVPASINVAVASGKVKLTAGSKSIELSPSPNVDVKWDQAARAVTVSPREGASLDDKQVRADWGTARAHIQNAVKGLSTGFEKALEVNGAGYTAVVSGNRIDLKVGFANMISHTIPAGVEVNVDKNVIKIKGADRQKVGQFAAVVRATRKPEPYNAKGIKYVEEVIQRKQGKQFGA